MNECVFCKIARKEMPKEFEYEDQDLMVFPDIHPIKPVHLLLVPKRHIKDFGEITDNQLWVKIKDVAQKMINEKQMEGRGYRIGINGGGAQIVDHLHLHLMSPWGKNE